VTLLLPALIFGLLAGAWPGFPAQWLPWANQLAFSSIMLLLLAMGAKVGGDATLLASLGQMGVQAALLALAAVAGSLIFTWIVAKKVYQPGTSVRGTSGPATTFVRGTFPPSPSIEVPLNSAANNTSGSDQATGQRPDDHTLNPAPTAAGGYPDGSTRRAIASTSGTGQRGHSDQIDASMTIRPGEPHFASQVGPSGRAGGSAAFSGSVVSSASARVNTGHSGQTNGGHSSSGNGSTIFLILSFFGAGLFLGRLVVPPALFTHLDAVATAALALSFVGVGVDLGYNRQRAWRGLRSLGLNVLLFPLAVALGTLAGALLIAPWIGLSLTEAMAVAAGFGWYSLAGVLLAQIHSLSLGTIAFLTNLLRELLALLLIPLVARRLGKIMAVAPAGATAMDSTLPIISRSTDPETAVVAFLSGATLTALSPFLIPFLAGLRP